MASCSNTQSSKQEQKIKLNYEEIQKRYYDQVKINHKLLKGPLCTKYEIEEKKKQIITDPKAFPDLVVDTKSGKCKLYRKVKKAYLEVISAEDAFDLMLDTHIACDHANASITHEKLSIKYSVPIFIVCWLVGSCNVCHPKVENKIPVLEIAKNVPPNAPRVRTTGVWRMNIINDSSLKKIPRSTVRYLLILKENSTNFVLLRPIYETTTELALDLMKLFSEFGCPEKVLVPNMIEFYKRILKMVYLIYPVANVPVEESSDIDIFAKDKMEVLNALENWMKTMDDIYWDTNCHIVQYKLNTTERRFTRMDTKEECIGVPFNLFFQYEAREEMIWLDPQAQTLSDTEDDC